MIATRSGLREGCVAHADEILNVGVMTNFQGFCDAMTEPVEAGTPCQGPQ
jgi:hypothetical protein